MMKLFFAVLIVVSSIYAADPNYNGTWKINSAKSDVSKVPEASRDATMTITDNGWTYTEIDKAGNKSDLTDKGDDKVTVKDEPTGNPYLRDVRFILKENNKEIQRTVVAMLPDGKAFLTYASGITKEGKPFTDVLYWERSH